MGVSGESCLPAIDMVFPVAQRSEADGKNLIGLSAGQDEGMSVEYPRLKFTPYSLIDSL